MDKQQIPVEELWITVSIISNPKSTHPVGAGLDPPALVWILSIPLVPLARQRPRLPCVKGKPGAVAVVNDTPVECQSRHRGKPQLSWHGEAVAEGLYSRH